MDPDNKLLVNILEQIRDIRLCLDGKDGVIVRLDRLEQAAFRRQRYATAAFTLSLSAFLGVIAGYLKLFLKL